MSDNVEKKITISLAGKDDGASATIDKVDRRVDGLDKKLKTLGKISGISAFRGLSDLAEGMDKSLGAIGKAGVGLGIIEGASRSMKLIGTSLNDAIDAGEGFAGVLDRIGMKLPIIGSFRDGFESLTSGIAKATAAAFGFDTAIAGRRGKLAGKAISIFGMPEALSGAVDELSGTADNTAEGAALDARTKIIRKQIEDNKKDQEESNRIARNGMSERKKIETDRDAELEKIMERRRAWAARNGGISAEQEKQFANDELQIKADTNQKLAKLDLERDEQETKALNDKLKKQREYAKQLRDEARETQKIYANQDRSRAGLIGELMEGPRGEIQRLRDRTKETIQDIQAQIEDAKNDPNLSGGGRDARIKALQGAIDTEQTNAGIREGVINKRGVRDIDKNINAMNAQLFAAQEEQRQRENAARIKSLETQQGARTSNFDGRGQTGFFNQSKSIEDFNKKTAENTKITADELKKLTQLIAQNALGSLTWGYSL